MVRKYAKKKPKPNEDIIRAAIADMENGKFTLRQAARYYKLDKTTLMRRKNAKGVPPKPSGGQTSLPQSSELELAKCLKIKSKWGFADSAEELKDYVMQYVLVNKHKDNEIGEYLRKHCKFKDSRPGKDWLFSFLNRHHLSLKCPSALEKTRKTAASNPEIIYGYFDLVEKEVKKLSLENRPECIWNIDETSLFLNARKIKVIAPKGEKASRTQATSGREATTVMAGISAAGESLPPLIVFKGQKLQSTWKSNNAYPGTQYACSENGWMEAAIFYDWFKLFCHIVTQRPLLLVYDGHSTHISSDVINKAVEENVTILKLPPHTTDRLQPLDVVCFKPVKTEWDKEMAIWNKTNFAKRISKPEFVAIVGKVWPAVLKEDLIKKAFKKTGLYPVDRTVYPKSTFHPNLLHVYERVQILNCPPQAIPLPATPSKLTTPSRETNVLEISPIEVRKDSQDSIYKPSCSKSLSISFEEIMADRATTKQSPGPNQQKKRRRIDPHSRVITDETFLEEIRKIEEAREKKNQPKNKKNVKNKKQAPNKQNDIHAEDSSDYEYNDKVQRKKHAVKRNRNKCDKSSEEESDTATVLRNRVRKLNVNQTCKEKRKLTDDLLTEDKSETKNLSPIKKQKNDEHNRQEFVEETPCYTPRSYVRKWASTPKNYIISSSSEDEYLDDKEATNIKFSSKQYEKINPKEHEYYAVGYVNSCYIGRVEKVYENRTALMKFLVRKDNDKYDLPSLNKEAIEAVPIDNLYCGPIKLVNTVPFTILGVVKAFNDYKAYLKAIHQL